MPTSAKRIFTTEEEAIAYCDQRSDGHTWITWQLDDGRWAVAATNLPRREGPIGEAIEAKPKPPEPEDPSVGRPPAGPPLWAG